MDPEPERTAHEDVRSSRGATSTAPSARRPTDAELYAGVIERRHDAFAELYERYFHELYDFAARITHDREIAADIVQGVFATVWEHAGRGGEVRSPKAWLYRLTHNAAIDELRRRRRTVLAGEDESLDFAALEDVHTDEPTQALIDKELAELVWSTAAKMRPDEYGLLDLYVRRELTPDEVAEQLGISPGAAHTRLSRLRRSFEDALTVTLLKRRGGEDCEALGALVAELGADAESETGWRQLRDHVRVCPDCRSARGRYVTASKVLAGLAPVPLTPHLQGAIWASLCKLLGLGGAAGAAGASAAAHATAAGQAETGHLSSLFGAVRANPVVSTATAVAVAAAVGLGTWATVSTLRSSPTQGAVRDPARFWSPAPGSVRPSSENRITISWTRLPDAVGYSILWSHGPKDEPDTVADLPGSATRTTSAPLAPGIWYFHLRTHGHGDWTDTVHLGPFRIAPPRSDARQPAQPSAPSGRPSTIPKTKPEGESAAPTPAEATVVDSTPPSGQKAALAGGPYYHSLSVPLVLTRGSDAGSGVDPRSGVVERSGARLVHGSCGEWRTWSKITLHRSADTAVADAHCYRYRYRISDRAGNQAAPSPPSAAARIDTTPPAPPALSLHTSGTAVHVSGSTVFYRPSAGGSLVVSAAGEDSQSGIARVIFPALPGASGGGEDATAPYETGYSWSALDANGTQTVTATNGAGLGASAAFTLTADAEGPTGVSVAAAASGAAIAVAVAEGSDLASGVDPASLLVERDEASPGVLACGSFAGSWTPVTLADGKDSTVVSGTCYRYRVVVADNVGNTTASAASRAVFFDATPPWAPTLTLEALSGTYISGSTVFYRLVGGSFAVAATSSDPDSGIAEILFPALPAASGGGSEPTAPYRTTYAWTMLVAPWLPTAAVSATNGAGLVASSSFTLTNDDLGPSVAITVTRLGMSGHIRVEIHASDAGSGVAATAPLVERDSASREGGECGSFGGAWTQVVLDADGVDDTALSNTCYRYRVTVSDNVGNTSQSPPVDAG